MKKVSIIVPIYNSELYLKECIDSILSQSYENIELILINDGSNDDSSSICKDYLGDKRVKYLEKENGGVSSARNLGIDNATGEYLMFVDSDDYIDKNMVELLIENVKDNETIVCGYKEVFLDNVIVHKPNEDSIKNTELINMLFYNSNICGFLVNKIYETRIIKENKMYLNTNIHMCEDLLFNVQYMLNINKAIIINQAPYNYRMRNNSATWNKKDESLEKCLKLLDELLKKNNLYNVEYLYFKLTTMFKRNKKNIEELKKEYKLVMKSNKISFSKKVKLFIIKNMLYIYKLYMNLKVQKNKLFE